MGFVVLGNYIHGNDVSRYGTTMADWDVSRISDFSNLLNADLLDWDAFDEDLRHWDMANATNLDGMFQGQTKFQGRGLEYWNVSGVTSMRGTFENCASFDGTVQDWNPGMPGPSNQQSLLLDSMKVGAAEAESSCPVVAAVIFMSFIMS